MDRRSFILLSMLGGAGLAATGLRRSWAMEMLLKDAQELDKLGYFFKNSAGELVLKPEVADKVIDFHAHIKLSYFFMAPVDLEREDKEVKTYFPVRGNPVNLSEYASMDYTKENTKIAQNESLKQAFTNRGYAGTHTPKNLLRDMDNSRVVKAVILPIDYPLGAATTNTKTYLKAAKMYPRLVPFASVHPYDSAVEHEVRKFKKMGAVGMKIHPPMQFIRANNKRCMKLTKLCGELGLPCLFHAGASDIAPKFQADYPRIEYFWEPVQKQPGTTFILGHGGIHFYKELTELARKNQNVWIELSGQAPDPIKCMLDAGLEDRLLYGSDWPYYIEALPMAKVLIATEGAPVVRKKILFDNAAKLFQKMGVAV